MNEMIPHNDQAERRAQEHPALSWIALGLSLVALLTATTPQGILLAFMSVALGSYRLARREDRK